MNKPTDVQPAVTSEGVTRALETLAQISALADRLPRVRISMNSDPRQTIKALCAEIAEALPRKVDSLKAERVIAEKYLAQPNADVLYGEDRVRNIDRELALLQD